jgi:hypothetical protein
MSIKLPKNVQEIKIQIEAKYIQNNTTVSKPGSDVEYKLTRNIKIHGPNGEDIHCTEGSVFLISQNQNKPFIEIANETDQFIVTLDPEDVIFFIHISQEDDDD